MSQTVVNEPERNADLLEEYLVDAKLRGLTDRTIETYQSQLEYFVDWLDVDFVEVRRGELKRFLSHLKHERVAIDGSTGLTPSTLKSYFSAMNSLYKFLV